MDLGSSLDSVSIWQKNCLEPLKILLIERWGRIAGSLYEVKKIENLIVILETKDAKNQILTYVSRLPVFYDKKGKID
jgi:hypothetical protein